MTKGTRILSALVTVVISAALLCLGCKYTSLDTDAPDVPPLRDTYQPPMQQSQFVPQAEGADTSHTTAAHEWLIAHLNAVIDVDKELLAGEQAAQAWLDKQGPQADWTDEQAQVYRHGQELADSLNQEREMLVKEYNSTASMLDPEAFLSDDSEPLPRKM